METDNHISWNCEDLLFGDSGVIGITLKSGKSSVIMITNSKLWSKYKPNAKQRMYLLLPVVKNNFDTYRHFGIHICRTKQSLLRNNVSKFVLCEYFTSE